MSALLAGTLAALAALAAFVSIALWRTEDLLSERALVRAGRAPGASALEWIGRLPERTGGLPLVRRFGLSASAAERLETSGRDWSPGAVVGVKAALAVTTLLGFGALLTPLVGLPLAYVAWRVPDLALARLARRTLRAADREIPVLLDLLAVATSAGLPPQLAFRRAVEGAEGPLATSLRSVVNATDLGGRWRYELQAIAERLALPDLRRLIRALTRTEAVGSSLSGEVARLAVDVREVRRTAASQRARTAPVKMLFPLVFLVLPAFLLLTVVPVLLTTVRSIA